MSFDTGRTRISVVTPSFNQGEFITEAIESIRSQRYADCEHVVVDNSSSDNTLAILAKYTGIRWVSEPDSGQSDALNKGFRMARGELIGWLNADDRYLPRCFEKVSAFNRDNPDVDVIYGDYRWIDQSGKVIQIRRELDYDLFMLKYVPFLYIPPPTIFFRRHVFESDNLFDVSYRYALDYEFILRLALRRYKFGHIPAILTDFRVHGGSTSVRYKGLQRKEQDRALFQHDPFLRTLPWPLRGAVCVALRATARAKRCTLKALKGHYFEQWPVGGELGGVDKKA